ncbi:MAG TPA: AI-2E family transporter, partial [Chitinophagaceae bacterium]|nr:AI-2E family transporter [Chitinophagaceae bacterium]
MVDSLKIPFYAKAALIFISIFGFVFMLYIGQDIILPVLFATIIAVLLNPLVNYLIRKKINKIVAISVAVVFTIFLALGFFYVISSQVAIFSKTFPQLKIKLDSAITQLLHWFSQKFKISEIKINNWMKGTQGEAISNFAIGKKLTEAGRIIIVGMLMPVYLFLILYYKPLLLEFIRKLFPPGHHVAVVRVLTNSKKIIQSYLVGLFFELVIVSVLNSIGLLLLGIEYAIILGITGAILNIIPYIGGIIAIALPMIIALVTKNSVTYPILVFFIYVFIQFIDNHYIVPKIVASRVKINALISI